MPIYEFRCSQCGHKVEQLCRVGEDGTSLVCPSCGGTGLKRRQSTFSAKSTGSNGVSSAVGGKSCGPT